MTEENTHPAGYNAPGRVFGYLGMVLFFGGAIGLIVMATSENGTPGSQYINYDVVANRIVYTLVASTTTLAGAVMMAARVVTAALTTRA